MNNHSIYTINSTASLISAMTQMDQAAKGIIFVVDDQTDVLSGALSDGDIRRHLLKGFDLNVKVREVMNSHPVYATQPIQANELESILSDKKIDAIPILDDLGKVQSIYFKGDYQQVKKIEPLHLPVVIMAGGKGTRLAPYTSVLPKPLIPVAGKTITEHIMEQFKVYSCDQFKMIVNYKKNLIKAYFQDQEKNYQVNFIDELVFQGTGGGLSLLKNEIKDTFFLTNCDILVDCDFAEALHFHREREHILTIIGAEMSMTVPYGTVLANESGQVEGFVEKPQYDFIANTGIYIIEPEFLNFIPENTFIHITEIIEKCIADGKSIGMYKIKKENWFDMGQHESLLEMEEHLKNKYCK